MENKEDDLDVNNPEENDEEESSLETTPPEGSEPVKTPEEEAQDLLGKKNDKKIVVDKDRFNDRNDKAKLYETFAPVIDKIKDNPELVEELLDINNKGSLADRVAQMERERKDEKQRELRGAVTSAISKWPSFKKDWSEIESQVTMFIQRGVSPQDAIRRSYLALHPEEAETEAKRIAQENANATGQFQSGGGRSPVVIDTKESPKLNERERKVAHDLMGKNMHGTTLFKSEEDYANALKKHDAHLRATGFYDLP